MVDVHELAARKPASSIPTGIAHEDCRMKALNVGRGNGFDQELGKRAEIEGLPYQLPLGRTTGLPSMRTAKASGVG
ncbi:MAG: hypothetical protein ACOCWU_06640 [Spirochaetota bacterium]